MSANTKTHASEGWITSPTKGVRYDTLNFANGQKVPPNSSARKVTIISDGDLYLIPVGGSAAAGVERKSGCLAGEEHIVFHDGIGTDSTCDVIADF